VISDANAGCTSMAVGQVCVYIYIHIRATPGLCSIEVPHSQSNVVATLHSIGKIKKVLGNIKVPPPLNFTFVEDLH